MEKTSLINFWRVEENFCTAKRIIGVNLRVQRFIPVPPTNQN